MQVNTYQAVIATDGTTAYALFLYRDVQWSRSVTNIGFNAGDGIRGFNLERPEGSLTFDGIEETSNIETPGTYIFRIDLDFILQPSGTH